MNAQEFINLYKEYLYDSEKKSSFDSAVYVLINDTLQVACQWIKDHVEIPYEVETNEDGQPLALSFFLHAEKRCKVAEEIGNKFLEDMEKRL